MTKRLIIISAVYSWLAKMLNFILETKFTVMLNMDEHTYFCIRSHTNIQLVLHIEVKVLQVVKNHSFSISPSVERWQVTLVQFYYVQYAGDLLK